MNSEQTPPTASDHAVVMWLESAPDVAKAWLRDDITTINVLTEQRNRSFQMVGQYDGAMSEGCKRRFRQQYEFLTNVIEWCKGNENGTSS